MGRVPYLGNPDALSMCVVPDDPVPIVPILSRIPPVFRPHPAIVARMGFGVERGTHMESRPLLEGGDKYHATDAVDIIALSTGRPIWSGPDRPAMLSNPTPRPLSEPPRRSDVEILHAIRANLEMARDLTALKLATLKSGSSSYKTTAGMLRGFNECLGVIESEWGHEQTDLGRGGIDPR
jgi:hypothetical protein